MADPFRNDEASEPKPFVSKPDFQLFPAASGDIIKEGDLPPAPRRNTYEQRVAVSSRPLAIQLRWDAKELPRAGHPSPPWLTGSNPSR